MVCELNLDKNTFKTESPCVCMYVCVYTYMYKVGFSSHTMYLHKLQIN